MLCFVFPFLLLVLCVDLFFAAVGFVVVVLCCSCRFFVKAAYFFRISANSSCFLATRFFNLSVKFFSADSIDRFTAFSYDLDAFDFFNTSKKVLYGTRSARKHLAVESSKNAIVLVADDSLPLQTPGHHP